jgi:hypothetical protein
MRSTVIDGLQQKFARSAVAGKSCAMLFQCLPPPLTCSLRLVQAHLYPCTRGYSDWPNYTATGPPLSDYNRLHILSVWV